MNIDDMHVQQILPGMGSAYIDNAATARSSGAELQWRYGFAPGWQLRGNATFNRTRFRHFSDTNGRYDGNHNLYAPDLQGTFGLRYENPRGWYGQADLLASGRIYLDAANRNHRPGFGRLDMSAGYQFRAFDISAYVANVTDHRYDAVGYLPGIATLYSPPREAGIRLHYAFDSQ
jgi:iron complex outermembrane recepter protein